jgi:hypothetical protein
LGTHAIRDTVQRALEEVVRADRTKNHLELMRTIERDLTPEDLERWRGTEQHHHLDP